MKKPPRFVSTRQMQTAARAYTRRWHRTYEWALSCLPPMWEIAINPLSDPRVQQIKGAIVDNLYDEEQAFKKGIPLEEMYFYRGPTMAEGGRRRVIIRALTWVPDYKGEVAYDMQWATVASRFTGQATSAAANRYIASYAHACALGIESRRILVTAMEIRFWTQSKSATDV